MTRPLWPLAPQGPCLLYAMASRRRWAKILDASHRLLLNECRSAVSKHHADLSAFLESSSNHLFGERIANRSLNRPAHRSGAVKRFIPFFDQPLLDVILDLNLYPLVEETKVEFTQKDIEDVEEMRALQRRLTPWAEGTGLS